MTTTLKDISKCVKFSKRTMLNEQLVKNKDILDIQHGGRTPS